MEANYAHAHSASMHLVPLMDGFTASERVEIYKLQALSALLAGDRPSCSSAITKLEVFDDPTRFKELALKLFSKPRDEIGSGNSTKNVLRKGSNQEDVIPRDANLLSIDSGKACCEERSTAVCERCSSIAEENPQNNQCPVCHQIL